MHYEKYGDDQGSGLLPVVARSHSAAVPGVEAVGAAKDFPLRGAGDPLANGTRQRRSTGGDRKIRLPVLARERGLLPRDGSPAACRPGRSRPPTARTRRRCGS